MLYNPGLKTSYIMIPGLAGVVLCSSASSSPASAWSGNGDRDPRTARGDAAAPRDVFLGKIAAYFAVAAADLALVLAVGVALFGVPFRGWYAVFALGALLFLFVTLGIGVLISSVSENQGQAIQMAFMFTLPQVLLSGLIFPLSSIAVGVRWISYLLPLTYFNEISRGVMLRAEPIGGLWPRLLLLALLRLVVMLTMLRFRTTSARPEGGSAGRAGRAPARRAPRDPAGPRARRTSRTGAWGTQRGIRPVWAAARPGRGDFQAAPRPVSAVVGGDGAGAARCCAA